MAILRLNVSGVRNLHYVSLADCGRINIISGPNGSGKTSLLEAIYLLGMGRSFRSIKISPLINHEMDRAAVYAELSGSGGQRHSLGLLKGRGGEQQLRIDRRPVSSLAELARVLPIQILDSDGFSLVVGGSKTRRQFMDWGVFHVKPPFMELWRRAQKALRQRNCLLRSGHRSMNHIKEGRARIDDPARLVSEHLDPEPLDFDAWDRELAQCAEQIDRLRQEYLTILEPHFLQKQGAFVDLPTISLHYRRGWRADESLLDLLLAGRKRDRELGYTQMGPHRATLEIRANGLPAAEILSRGQQKLVVASLKLAQGACLAEFHGSSGVYLVDDLPAELDRKHRQTLCHLLDGLGSQVFMTGVDADAIEGALSGFNWSKQDEIRRFHVEQGEYRCLMK